MEYDALRAKGVAHHFTLKSDLVPNRHLFDCFQVRQYVGSHNVVSVVRKSVVHRYGGPLHVIERHIRILGHLYQRRKWVQIAERQQVIPMTRHFVDELVPEMEAPISAMLFCAASLLSE